jgi:hypothetical protein
MMLLDNSDFLGSFIQRKYHETLVINGLKDGKTGLETGAIREPRGALSARYEPDTKLLFVIAKVYREECNKGQLNFDESLEMYRRSKAFLGTKRKRLAAGSIVDTGVNTPSLVFDTRKLPSFKEEVLLVKDTESDDTYTVDEA